MAYRLDLGRLAALPLLGGLDAAHLEPIAARMQLRRAAPGEVLSREGDPGHTFWLVLEGEVQVTIGERWLADAGPGAILGELSVLRHQPRTATVSAVSASLLAAGDETTLQLMLEVPEVRNRIRRLASSRLAHDLRPVRATLPNGTTVLVRPLLPEDRPSFDEAVHSLSQDSLRKRFFSPGNPSQSLIDFLIDIDYVEHFAWLARSDDQSPGFGVSRYVRSTDPSEAEMAFGVVDRHQGRGIGTLLFGALGVAAHEAGIKKLVAHVLDDNLAMRAVFAKADPHTRFDEPGVLYVEVEPEAAAATLSPSVREELGSAVHDVVTAASLALSRPSG